MYSVLPEVEAKVRDPLHLEFHSLNSILETVLCLLPIDDLPDIRSIRSLVIFILRNVSVLIPSRRTIQILT